MSAGADIVVAGAGSGGSGTVSDVTSTGGTITVTTPTGPTVNVEVTTPAPSPATTVTGPDAFGAAAVVGTGTEYARIDHDHGLPAAPSPSLTYSSSYISSGVTLNAATATNVTSLSLGAGTWLIMGNVTASASSSATNLDAWIGPNSASHTGAYASGSTYLELSTLGYASVDVAAIVTLGSTTTVYLEAESTAAGVANVNSYNGVPNATGMFAVKIG